MTSNTENIDDSNNNDDTFRLTRLAEEIEALKGEALILESDFEVIWAQQLKLAANKIQERELLLEKVRVDQVKQAYEEQRRTSTYKAEEEDCPICLETMQGEEIDEAPHFMCCGKFTCNKCHGLYKLRKCPLCRSKIPSSDNEQIVAIKKLAEKGNAWAQCTLARHYEYGTNGVEVNKALAIEWCRRAAEQGYSLAMLVLACLYYENITAMIPECTEYAESRRWYQATIDRGHQCHAIAAMKSLRRLNIKGQDVLEDTRKVVRLNTLITAYSPADPAASLFLGTCFNVVGGIAGLEKSLDCAEYYLRLATKHEKVFIPGFAQFELGKALHDLARERYHGRVNIPGHSIVPESLHWARKGLAMGNGEAAAFIEQVEQELKSSCAECKRNANKFTDNLKCCMRCRAVWYCGKDCQMAHWRKGHKIDCFQSDEK